MTTPHLPLVSIIVVCHNYGRFLAEAIESALAQTYPNREVLVVDDGSTDDSLEVASRYRDSIRILTHPNMGFERTCNRAVGEARGEYFAFLSADDVFEPAYVEELVAALRRSPDASFAYCRARMFGARSGLTRGFPFSVYLLVRMANYINGSALTRRADYIGVGGYDELGEHANEDWDFWLKMVEAGKRGTFVRTPLLRWRRHAAGSRNPEGGRLERSRLVLRDRHRALEESVSDRRGDVAYALDLAAAAADLVFGLSRSGRLVRALERRSWRRFQRWHAPRLRQRGFEGVEDEVRKPA
jgi:glycosyltransferase involved in cell wall biosynthesis